MYSTTGTANQKLDIKQSAVSVHSLHKFSSYALVGLVPAALIVEPSSLVYPMDLALGLLLPFHFHLLMKDVVRDYAPNPKVWQYVLMGVSVATALGLTKLNFNGDGVTASAKRLWKKK